jgi:ABC-type lipoprotein release transport system permease subunit
VSAYLFGVIIAFLYVYELKAPLLKQIFLGFNNLSNGAISFTPVIYYADLALLFLIFVIPFLLMILTPIWRVATIEPSEILR